MADAKEQQLIQEAQEIDQFDEESKAKFFDQALNFLLDANHIWCKYYEIVQPLVHLYMHSDKIQHIRKLKKRTQKQIAQCSRCMHQYHDSKKWLRVLYSKHYTEESVKELLSCLRQMEQERLIETLTHCSSSLNSPALEGDGVIHLLVAFAEILNHLKLLENETIHELFVKRLLEVIKQAPDMSVPKRNAGIYLLLMHPEIQIRAWAKRTVKTFGAITVDAFQQVRPALYRCICFIQSDTPENYHHFSSTKRIFWTGFYTFIKNFDVDCLETRVLMEFRELGEIIFRGLQNYESDSHLSQVLLIFDALLETLGYKLWYNVGLDYMDYSFVYNILKKKIVQTTDEFIQKSILQIVQHILWSVEPLLEVNEYRFFIGDVLTFFYNAAKEETKFSPDIRIAADYRGFEVLQKLYSAEESAVRVPLESVAVWASPLIRMICNNEIKASIRSNVQDLFEMIVNYYNQQLRRNYQMLANNLKSHNSNEIPNLSNIIIEWPHALWKEYFFTYAKDLPPRILQAVLITSSDVGLFDTEHLIKIASDLKEPELLELLKKADSIFNSFREQATDFFKTVDYNQLELEILVPTFLFLACSPHRPLRKSVVEFMKKYSNHYQGKTQMLQNLVRTNGEFFVMGLQGLLPEMERFGWEQYRNVYDPLFFWLERLLPVLFEPEVQSTLEESIQDNLAGCLESLGRLSVYMIYSGLEETNNILLVRFLEFMAATAKLFISSTPRGASTFLEDHEVWWNQFMKWKDLSLAHRRRWFKCLTEFLQIFKEEYPARFKTITGECQELLSDDNPCLDDLQKTELSHLCGFQKSSPKQSTSFLADLPKKQSMNISCDEEMFIFDEEWETKGKEKGKGKKEKELADTKKSEDKYKQFTLKSQAKIAPIDQTRAHPQDQNNFHTDSKTTTTSTDTNGSSATVQLVLSSSGARNEGASANLVLSRSSQGRPPTMSKYKATSAGPPKSAKGVANFKNRFEFFRNKNNWKKIKEKHPAKAATTFDPRNFEGLEGVNYDKEKVVVKPKKNTTQTRILALPTERMELRERIVQENLRKKVLLPPLDELHKHILLWDYNKLDKLLTEYMSEFKEIKPKYSSVDEYLGVFYPLLLEEFRAQLEKGKEDASGFEDTRVFKEKILGIEAVDNFQILKFLDRPRTDCLPRQDWHIRADDIILLTQERHPEPDGTYKGLHLFGKIEEEKVRDPTSTDRNKYFRVRVLLRTSNPELRSKLSTTVQPEKVWYLKKIVNVSTINREYAALITFEHLQLVPQILVPSIEPLPEESGSKGVDRPLINQFDINKAYNPSQINAIKAVFRPGFSIVQGPPGTGKTKTILGMLSAILHTPNKKVLLCAPSNAAIDELITRLADYGLFTIRKIENNDHIMPGTVYKNDGSFDKYIPHMVRIGVTHNVLPHILPYTSSFRVQQKVDLQIKFESQCDEKHGSWKKKNKKNWTEEKKKLEVDIIGESSIVCATLNSSGLGILAHLPKNHPGFSTVIIDEAAQAVELSTLIPLKYSCKTCVLVGDPQQLPATVISKKAGDYKYEQSLMARFIENKVSPLLLDVQYRMHPSISKFPSKHFYRGLLKDGPNTTHPSYNQPYHTDDLFKAFVFFNVESTESRPTKSIAGHTLSSLKNLTEAYFVAKLIQNFIGNYPDIPIINRLGVITPYRQQLQELNSQLKRLLPAPIFDGIEVSTVDGFQGKEKDIIILSCVRAHMGSTIGFLADIRRMNVAITRARHSLWIVGNLRSLIINDHWQALIHYAKVEALYVYVQHVDPFWVQREKRDAERKKKILSLESKKPNNLKNSLKSSGTSLKSSGTSLKSSGTTEIPNIDISEETVQTENQNSKNSLKSSGSSELPKIEISPNNQFESANLVLDLSNDSKKRKREESKERPENKKPKIVTTTPAASVSTMDSTGDLTTTTSGSTDVPNPAKIRKLAMFGLLQRPKKILSKEEQSRRLFVTKAPIQKKTEGAKIGPTHPPLLPYPPLLSHPPPLPPYQNPLNAIPSTRKREEVLPVQSTKPLSQKKETNNTMASLPTINKATKPPNTTTTSTTSKLGKNLDDILEDLKIN